MTVVIDLRAGDCDLEQVEGRIVVIDHAETAAENDQLYQALLGSPRVYGLICLAVARSMGPVLVRPAPSLAPVERAATVWAGHEHGIRWQPTDPFVSAVTGTEPSNLDCLIDVLGESVVFDGVVRTVSTLPYSTAAVGMALKRTSLHNDELRRVGDEAIAEFTDPDAGWDLARELPRSEFRSAIKEIKIDAEEDVLLPAGELAATHRRAVEAISAAEHELVRLGNFLVPLGRRRIRRHAADLAEQAHSATTNFVEEVTRQLQRIDDNLRGRSCSREQVTQLGVRGPITAYPRQARDDVRGLTEEWLEKYRSIAHIRPDLDTAKIEQAPQGCLDTLQELHPPARYPSGAARHIEWRWNIGRWRRQLDLTGLRRISRSPNKRWTPCCVTNGVPRPAVPCSPTAYANSPRVSR